jgi:hypothetical protein
MSWSHDRKSRWIEVDALTKESECNIFPSRKTQCLELPNSPRVDCRVATLFSCVVSNWEFANPIDVKG